MEYIYSQTYFLIYRIIIRHCFDNWRKFPEIVYKERLKDCRLRTWHEKVQEILPDFVPPEL